MLTTLKRISTSYAVAFDLELSGIPERKRRARVQTLQERYAEVKEAAEKYHILQLGITLIEEDQDAEKYVLRTYNYNLTPIADEVFGLDRDFTYSSGAVQFLLRNNYRMESPFFLGIPYLRPDEDARAKNNYMKRFDRAAIPNLDVSHDANAMDMVQRLRDEVKAWLKIRKVCSVSLH